MLQSSSILSFSSRYQAPQAVDKRYFKRIFDAISHTCESMSAGVLTFVIKVGEIRRGRGSSKGCLFVKFGLYPTGRDIILDYLL